MLYRALICIQHQEQQAPANKRYALSVLLEIIGVGKLLSTQLLFPPTTAPAAERLFDLFNSTENICSRRPGGVGLMLLSALIELLIGLEPEKKKKNPFSCRCSQLLLPC